MGEANRRGTYEFRKAEGELKLAQRIEERRKYFAAKEANMTDEEREQRHKARMVISMASGLEVRL